MVCWLLTGLTAKADDPNAADRAAIASRATAYVEAFHKGDADALAAFWTPEGDYIHLSGRVIKGRAALAAEFKQLFAEAKGLKLRVDIQSLRFPTADTAVEDGVTSVMSDESPVPSRARYTNYLIKIDGKWMIESVRELPYQEPNNYEYLRSLEWIVGEWVEDTTSPHASRALFDWSADQNYILCLRAVSVKDIMLDNGSQRIGWDPANKVIRSWSFEADGGFGHGVWQRSGDNTWTVKNAATLRSGSTLTSTNTITRVDIDNVTWQATEQKLDGQPIADSPVIKMKRVK